MHSKSTIVSCSLAQVLLQSPNPDDPLDTNVAALWKSNLEDAQARAKAWTLQYAAPAAKAAAAEEAEE